MSVSLPCTAKRKTQSLTVLVYSLRLCCADMMKQMQAFQQGGPWVQGRNFAVLSGVGAGLSIALKRIRKTDDVYNT